MSYVYSILYTLYKKRREEKRREGVERGLREKDRKKEKREGEKEREKEEGERRKSHISSYRMVSYGIVWYRFFLSRDRTDPFE